MQYLTHPDEPKDRYKHVFVTELGLRFANRDTLKHQVLGIKHIYQDTDTHHSRHGIQAIRHAITP